MMQLLGLGPGATLGGFAVVAILFSAWLESCVLGGDPPLDPPLSGGKESKLPCQGDRKAPLKRGVGGFAP